MDYSLAVFNLLYLNSLYDHNEISEGIYQSLRDKLMEEIVKTLSPFSKIVTEKDIYV